MRTQKRRWLWLGAVIGLGLGLGACQTIAGIEDRKLDPDAEHSAACSKYCSDVMTACQGDNAVYTTEEVCLGVCQRLEPGDPKEPVGSNTLACRAFQTNIARAEPDENCRSAGPGGDGQCGSDCEAYCDLFAKSCPDDDNEYPSVESCVDACQGLTDQRRFDVVLDYGGDTIECRLIHVSSSTIDPAKHCSHATIRPSELKCTGKPEDPPTCDEYCNIAQAACDGDLAQYESLDQCRAVCGALDPGTNADEVENTIGCRRYHSFSATLAAAQHCPHAGPTGDGHCGHDGIEDDTSTANCESYCLILAKACPDEFDAAMTDAEQCMASCIELDESKAESKYSVAKAKQSTALGCRVLYAARAFEDPTACASAIGGDPCAP